MAIGSQYGEDQILQEFFGDQPEGYLVDIGAADGKDNSNSWLLLKRPGWKGILVEPDPPQFKELEQRYLSRPGVKTVPCAVGSLPGPALLHSCLQVSTLVPSWRKKCEDAYGVEYTEVWVQIRTLTEILFTSEAPAEFDFLSIDCEGADHDVLASLDLERYTPQLICLELPTDIPGYKVLAQTRGNTLYVRAD